MLEHCRDALLLRLFLEFGLLFLGDILELTFVVFATTEDREPPLMQLFLQCVDDFFPTCIHDASLRCFSRGAGGEIDFDEALHLRIRRGGPVAAAPRRGIAYRPRRLGTNAE